MWVVAGVIALIALTLVRPHEFVDALEGVPVLHLATALAVFGLMTDLAVGTTKLRRNPVTPWALAMLAWAAATLVRVRPDQFGSSIITLFTSVVLCLTIAQGVQTPRGFTAVASVVLACAVWVLSVGLLQGLSPLSCVVTEEPEGEPIRPRPDGRSCELRVDCLDEAALGDAVYECERAGPFGTTSVAGGRVRYLGMLQDPNELALTVGGALPLAYALRRQRRGAPTTVLALAMTVLTAVVIVMTRSRGGQLVLIVVLGCYFFSNTGVRGALVGLVLALPVVLLGGRSGASAEASAEGRVEAWYAAFDMLRAYPVSGVGIRQFVDHHERTAHNSYLLVLAEMGLPGLFLFLGALYVCAKIVWSGLRYYGPADVAPRAWAVAMLAAVSGISVGCFFLSFAYHVVPWTFMGLCGAYHGVAERADPGFRVRLTFRDYGYVGLATIGLTLVMYVFTRLRA